MTLINIGFGNVVASGRVVAVISSDSAPVRRLISDSRESGTLIDATCGRRTRAVIITDSGHIILTQLQSETVATRLTAKAASDDEESEDAGK
jgi:regulator of extracellular matrix RemA (YlzA/DUF370 family)